MAVPFLNLSTAQAPQPNTDYLTSAMDAYRQMQMPRWLNSKQKLLDQENQLMSTRNQYAPQLWQQRLQQLGLSNQASALNLQYLPKFLQQKLTSGDIGNQMGAEQLKFLPQMESLKEQLAQAQLAKLMQPTSNVTPARSLSPLGKFIMERQNVQHLMSPDGSSQLTSPEAVQLLNAYDSGMLKNTTDANTRKRLGFANQMDITLNSMDGNILTQYSGPQGKFNLLADKTAAAAGHPPLRFQRYMQQAELAQEFTKQYRQFAGDSVQPSNVARIKSLVDPSSWTTDPATAAQMFNTLASSARTEGDNLRTQALDVNKWLQAPTTDVYGNQASPNNAALVPSSVQASGQNLRTTFADKQDFDNYMSSLSPAEKTQLKAMLGI